MNRMYLALFALMIIVAPIWGTGATNVMILLFVLSFRVRFEQKSWQAIPVWIWIFAVYFAMFTLGLLWTEHMDEGWRALEKKAVFLILPVVCWAAIRAGFTRDHLRVLLWIGVGLAFAVMGYTALGRVADGTPVLMAFTGSSLSGDFIHRAYFMNYVAITLLMTVFSARNRLRWQDVLLLAGGLLLFGMLQGRMNIIALVAAVPIALFSKSQAGSRRWILPILIAVVFGSSWFFNFPPTRFSEKAAETELNQLGSDEVPDKVSRIFMWKSALNIYAENPVLGVGTGDIHAEIEDYYRSVGHEASLKKSHNVHNEYLQTLTTLGPVGLLALLAMFLLPAWTALKRKDGLLLATVVYLGLTLLTEVYFDRFQGIFVVALILSLLWGPTIRRE